MGGGGLIAGTAIAAKALNPAIRIFGVQTTLFPAMAERLKGRAASGGGSTVAEGIAVKQPGEITRAIIAALVDDIVLVTEADIERAVGLLITIEKTVVEGAGAAGLAAVLSAPEMFRGRTVGLILCGGNIDTRLLSSVLTRELAREGFDLTRLREQPAPFCQHGFACSREAHAVTLTIQQRDAELLFELSHLITDGRLYLVQLLRGVCEAAEANDGVQSFHGVEVESHDVLYF